MAPSLAPALALAAFRLGMGARLALGAVALALDARRVGVPVLALLGRIGFADFELALLNHVNLRVLAGARIVPAPPSVHSAHGHDDRAAGCQRPLNDHH